MLNTHSKYGDCRMEILAAHAGAAGVPQPRLEEILDCAACDDAIRILREEGKQEPTLRRVTARIQENLRHRAGEMEAEAIVFSKVYGILGMTDNAEALLEIIKHPPPTA